MVNFRVNNNYLEYEHPPTNSYIPVIAPVEIDTGYLVRLVNSQEQVIRDILDELQALKIQASETKQVQFINSQEQLFNDIITKLEEVKIVVQTAESGGGGSVSTTTLEGLVSSILNTELPLIRNYLSSVNNKLPSGEYPVVLTLSQKELLDNIIALLGVMNTDVNSIGINTDDIYTKLQDILDQYPGVLDVGGDNLTGYLGNLVAELTNIQSLLNGTKGINQQTTYLEDIKDLLSGSDETGENIATKLDNIKLEIEAIRDDLLNPQEVLLADPQDNSLSDIPTKLDQIILNTAQGGSGGGSSPLIEQFFGELRNESNIFRQLPVEIVQRQETIINDIQAEANQIKRYMARLVDPLGVDIDGSQISVSQQIYDKLVSLEAFLFGRYASNPAKIVNITMGAANVEYSFTLPMQAKRYAIKARGGPNDELARIRFAFVPGIVASGISTVDDGYDTIYPDSEESDQQLQLTSPFTIYFASEIPNVTVVIKYWR